MESSIPTHTKPVAILNSYQKGFLHYIKSAPHDATPVPGLAFRSLTEQISSGFYWGCHHFVLGPVVNPGDRGRHQRALTWRASHPGAKAGMRIWLTVHSPPLAQVNPSDIRRYQQRCLSPWYFQHTPTYPCTHSWPLLLVKKPDTKASISISPITGLPFTEAMALLEYHHQQDVHHLPTMGPHWQRQTRPLGSVFKDQGCKKAGLMEMPDNTRFPSALCLPHPSLSPKRSPDTEQCSDQEGQINTPIVTRGTTPMPQTRLTCDTAPGCLPSSH